MRHWRELLLKAVSPLEHGVVNLDVTGYRPPGNDAFRPAKTAAVLVPLLDLPEPEIVLTRRADHLPQHPGQVSFPGGAAEEGDASAVQTALREAHEEIGLPSAAVRPIGFLDRTDTISDYRVLPVVALVTPPVSWIVDQSEVAEVFTIPLHIALNVELYHTRVVERQGREFRIYTLNWQGYRIWGVTAAMLMNLIDRMQRVHEQHYSDISSTAE